MKKSQYKEINPKKANGWFLLTVIIVFALLCGIANAQSNFRLNKVDSFNFSIVVDPSASIEKSGLNIGAEIEYNGTIYTRASITYFSSLKGGYLDFIGAAGVNFTSGMWEQFRYYSGLRAGIITRESNGYPTLGIECGIDYVIGSLVLGIRATRDKRSDFEFYNESSEMRGSGFVKIGFKL